MATCVKCGRCSEELELDWNEGYCDFCVVRIRRQLIGRLCESEEYYEMAAKDLDEFIAAMSDAPPADDLSIRFLRVVEEVIFDVECVGGVPLISTINHIAEADATLALNALRGAYSVHFPNYNFDAILVGESPTVYGGYL